jgi:hypothetical protein
MIKIGGYRISDGSRYDMPDRELTPFAAMCYVVTCELGFGGRVVSDDSEKIVLSTQVMHCVDYTEVTGSQQELELVRKGIRVFKELSEDNFSDVIADGYDLLDEEKFDRVGLCLKIGHSRSTTTILSVAGATEKFAEYAKFLGNTELGDAAEALYDGMSVDDVIEVTQILPRCSQEYQIYKDKYNV